VRSVGLVELQEGFDVQAPEVIVDGVGGGGKLPAASSSEDVKISIQDTGRVHFPLGRVARRDHVFVFPGVGINVPGPQLVNLHNTASSQAGDRRVREE
jgi:hypothetical protein